ncbi:MAG: hypothetical protein KME27_23180 [Lyngbya sp. HA4199-MV5]|jgi:hypothetical protein|nr:hypothetical protein [Lyngbya sp. HA4199-MV5]
MNTKQTTELVTLETAAAALGRGYSRSSILRRINSGEWREGIEWIDDRPGTSRYRLIKINLTAVEARRRKPAGKR